MAARDLPNLGLRAFYDLGEDGWKDDQDLGLLKLSVLVQPVVADILAAEPGAPANGDVVVLDETHATHPNEIAIRDDGAWVYVEPVEGWKVYVTADALDYRFDGTAWVPITEGGGGSSTITVSPETGSYTLDLTDANAYKIIDTSGAAANLTVPPESAEDFDIGTRIYVEQNGANAVTIVPGAGVTVHSRGAVFDIAGSRGVAVLFKKGADLWTLTGDLV